MTAGTDQRASIFLARRDPGSSVPHPPQVGGDAENSLLGSRGTWGRYVCNGGRMAEAKAVAGSLPGARGCSHHLGASGPLRLLIPPDGGVLAPPGPEEDRPAPAPHCLWALTSGGCGPGSPSALTALGKTPFCEGDAAWAIRKRRAWLKGPRSGSGPGIG